MRLNACLLIFCCFFLFSCQKRGNGEYRLEETAVHLSFPIDDYTRNVPKALFLYQDKDGTEYLTFQNFGKNEILFYDIQTQQLVSKASYEVEGENGVGFMWGYAIHNLDSIYLTSRGLPEIYLTDHTGNVKEKYFYESTIDSVHLGVYNSLSFLWIPLIQKENLLYFLPSCNRFNALNPLCATIDLDTKEVKALPYSYPALPNTENKNKKAGIELYVSRCFNGKEFVYSFYYDENLYILSEDHTQSKKIPAKSGLFESVVVPDDYGKMTFEEMCEIPNYGNIYYDPYREVYYRIAYPRTEIDKEIKPWELMDYGRKVFSVLILDKDFNVIGETLFPENTYNSCLLFIREDGLYISDSHYLNPDFDDDVLSFRRFVLKTE